MREMHDLVRVRVVAQQMIAELTGLFADRRRLLRSERLEAEGVYKRLQEPTPVPAEASGSPATG
jgi:hypothetical protein